MKLFILTLAVLFAVGPVKGDYWADRWDEIEREVECDECSGHSTLFGMAWTTAEVHSLSIYTRAQRISECLQKHGTQKDIAWRDANSGFDAVTALNPANPALEACLCCRKTREIDAKAMKACEKKCDDNSWGGAAELKLLKRQRAKCEEAQYDCESGWPSDEGAGNTLSDHRNYIKFMRDTINGGAGSGSGTPTAHKRPSDEGASQDAGNGGAGSRSGTPTAHKRPSDEGASQDAGNGGAGSRSGTSTAHKTTISALALILAAILFELVSMDAYFF